MPDRNDAARERYHHGDLRAALLDAAEEELRLHGVEGFTLRGCARRAGVSHAAPAHHFGDARGLLTALAALGYRRFVAAQERRKQAEGAQGAGRLIAAGLGYVDFARAHPALFRLIFASDRPDQEDPELCAAGEAAFAALEADVQAALGASATESPEGRALLQASWAMAHGIADLVVAGRLPFLPEGDAAGAEAMLRAMMARSLGAALAPPARRS
jgi:AcrR family transcriptional regulator